MFIMEDLTAADVIKKRGLRDVMANAYKNGERPLFRNGNLYINGKIYDA